MHKYLDADKDDDALINRIFLDELGNYSKQELIEAIDRYLDSHDRCIDFSLILINQGNVND